jgi:hypothetical protein
MKIKCIEQDRVGVKRKYTHTLSRHANCGFLASYILAIKKEVVES